LRTGALHVARNAHPSWHNTGTIGLHLRMTAAVTPGWIPM